MMEAIKMGHGGNQIGNSINGIYIPHVVFPCYTHLSTFTSITSSRLWDQEKVKRSLLQARIEQRQEG